MCLRRNADDAEVVAHGSRRSCDVSPMPVSIIRQSGAHAIQATGDVDVQIWMIDIDARVEDPDGHPGALESGFRASGADGWRASTRLIPKGSVSIAASGRSATTLTT